MIKYGVETSNEDRDCPLCCAPAERLGAVLRCPKHGSAPFEKSYAPAHGVESAGSGEDPTD